MRILLSLTVLVLFAGRLAPDRAAHAQTPSGQRALDQTSSSQNPPDAAATSAESLARSLVHVLDYMAADYAAAVQNGEVINQAEYEEMQNFAQSAASLLGDMTRMGLIDASRAPNNVASPSDRIAQLSSRIDEKAAPDAIAALARAIRNDILARTHVLSMPTQWPDWARGEAIYVQQCAACHGISGAADGPAAATLSPPPTLFSSGDRIASISPFQAYNTIRLGVEGTSMPAFQSLSDQEVWDVAFFVKSLQHESGTGRMPPGDLLGAVAMLGDGALSDSLRRRGIMDPEDAVHALRTHRPVQLFETALDQAEARLDSALVAYTAGRTSDARQLALRSYLEGIEPLEPAIGARDGTLLIEIENRMTAVRNDIENDAGVTALTHAVDRAKATIESARTTLAAESGGFWFSFLVAASILLREGLEAFLIILAILGVLHAAEQRRASRWVHGGWLAAVAVGIAGWFLSDLLLDFQAAHRELMEGAIALLAVVVLLYMGLWMHSMTAARRWQAFVEERIMRKLGTGSLFGLASLAFFAVFREAFESVLFLSALSLEAGDGTKSAVVGGALSAMLVILMLAPLALHHSRRLPIRDIFRYSAFVLGLLCVVLAGKGIHALQEAGFLPVTVLDTSFRVDLIGLYPSGESLLAQGVVVVILLVGMFSSGVLSRRAAS